MSRHRLKLSLNLYLILPKQKCQSQFIRHDRMGYPRNINIDKKCRSFFCIFFFRFKYRYDVLMCLRDNLRVILMKPFRIGRTSNNSKKLKHLRPNGGLMLIYLANRLRSIVLSSQKRFHFVMTSLKHWILIKQQISLQAIS